ncbi:MAG: hypothetical protein OXI44_11665 [Bacteroidota bacterium]|nr:hypothetical protein [Bacteroidota bacterium]MDE2827883.1 hypothetical protein [Bacteroidota bacterium]
MSTRVKSIVLLGCTLIAGILIGILGTSAWQHRRNAAIAEIRVQGGLMRQIEQIVEIESEEQREELMTVIRRAEQGFMRQRQHMSDSLAVYRQALAADLQRILGQEQWERVEEKLTRKRSKHSDRNSRFRRAPRNRDKSTQPSSKE